MSPMQFDWTINISDIFVMFGGAVSFIWAMIAVRDALRDLRRAVGEKDPPYGLLGDVEIMKAESQRHREWLIEMRSKLGFPIH